MWSEEYINKKLCSECGPKTYKNGEPTEYGKWHGIFKKRIFPLNSLYTDKKGNVRRKSDNKSPYGSDND